MHWSGLGGARACGTWDIQNFYYSAYHVVLVRFGDFYGHYIAGLRAQVRSWDLEVVQVHLAVDLWGHAFEARFPD